jgi:hypothetical protein
MKILALEQDIPSAAPEAFTAALLAEEARCAWLLHQSGVIRELYFRADRSVAVLVLESASLAEAQAALASLPLVTANLITFDLIPLRAYPGFARLFAEK